MRSILVHADRSQASTARIETALDIARATRGHVTAHVNTPIAAFVAMDPLGDTFISPEALAAAQARDDELVESLSATLSNEDVPWTIETSEADVVDALVHAARLEDLLIVALPSAARDGEFAAPSVGALALNARCPVLALPAAGRVDWSRPAMVAWNGSAESAHAVRAALPLLKLASGVEIVTIGDEQPGFPADAVLRYLSRHEVHGELRIEPSRGRTVEESLLAAAEAMGAGLLVMGAYGHSRLREIVFGGVTRFLTDAATMPLLLVH